MAGNKWYKCDLHLHSTASLCFQDKKVTAVEWVEECKTKGLDCVALTDHNTGSNIDEYKRVAEANGLIFFPGVELTCGENGTHLLILFERTASQTDVEDFLTRMDVPRKDWSSSEARSPKTVLDVIKFSEENGLIVIPAHIDEYNGIAYLKYGVRKKIFESSNIDAVQVVQKEFYDNRLKDISKEQRQELYDSVNARYPNKPSNDILEEWRKSVVEAEKNGMTILTFSDNPHNQGNSKHGLWGIGQRFSYIKMRDEPDLSSLRDALMLGENRVRSDFSDFSMEENEVVLQKMTFLGTNLSKKEIEVEFSNNLTTIIGGRGTGKSCITRLLVYVLGKEKELEKFPEIHAEYRNFAQIEQNGSGVFQNDTIVKLDVTYKGTKYQIVRTPQNHIIFECKQGQEPIETDIARLKMIAEDINLYSQKQIYEISKNQTSILELLDGYNVESISKLKNEIKSYSSEINKVNWDIVTLKNEIQDKVKIELEIEDLKKQAKKLSDKSYKDTYQNYLKETKKYKLLKDDINLLALIPDCLTTNIAQIDYGKNIDISDEINKSRHDLIENLKTHQEKIRQIINEMAEDIEQYRSTLNTSDWKDNFNKAVQKYNELTQILTPKELNMLENLDLLQQSLSNAEERLDKISKKEGTLEEYKEQVNSLMGKMNQAYQNLTNERRQSSKEIFSDIPGIQANIQQNRDFNNYVKCLRNIIQKEGSYDSEFSKLTNKLIQNEITEKDIFQDIVNIQNDKECTVFSDRKLINSLKKLSYSQVFDIQTLKPDDLIVIQLEVNGKKVSLSNASAGQKTSAILSMILAYGESPLILDQPEDDLDSQLINNLIVRSLIRRKENRQIIIVTHNANIPVNGDSEWLVSMGDSKEISVEQSGSVDEPGIKARICTVMEGGEDAFNNRAKRYGFKQILE